MCGSPSWDGGLKLIVPNRWVDEYSPQGFIPQPLPGLVGTFARVRVARPGVIQRHFYVTRPAQLAEALAAGLWRSSSRRPFSVPALQWGIACERLGIPWGTPERREPRPGVPLAGQDDPALDDSPRALLRRALADRGRDARALGGSQRHRCRAAHDSGMALRSNVGHAAASRSGLPGGSFREGDRRPDRRRPPVGFPVSATGDRRRADARQLERAELG